jgi:hypothetical protein
MHGNTPDEVSALRLRLRDAGFPPTPVVGKAPCTTAWQRLIDVKDADIAGWRLNFPNATNTGIITKYAPALDIDILKPDAVAAVVELVRRRFSERGRILLRTGLAPKVLIPFRMPACRDVKKIELGPFKKIPIAFKPATEGAKAEKLEFLADGQQFVAFGIHPDTGQPYTWDGGEPGDVTWLDLPEINEAEAKSLIEEAAQLLTDGFGYTRPNGKSSSKPSDNPFEAEGKGLKRGRTDKEIFELLKSSRHPENWHLPMRDAIASMVGRGWSKAVIKMVCAQYAEDGIKDRDIDKLIDTAIDKWQRQQDEKPPPPPPPPCSLDECHEVFQQYFGETFDLDALDIMLAVAASQKLDGDPVWLLVVSGSGAAKTEMVQSLGGAGAHITSTIASEGALLSGARKKVKNATGGLLRKIGSEGTLVIKDVTSILSGLSNEPRGAVLAALREIYDGRWERNVGSDGGQTLTWMGRITVIGAVTTAWDAHHAVVSVMGDRFVLVRIDSATKTTRLASGHQAMGNTGNEIEMRPKLAAAVGGVLANIQGCDIKLTAAERTRLVNAANIVTLARTAVELDYKRDVIDSHAPEMPTRFVKQLMQVVRGSVAVGISREKAMELAIRCARDSMSPLRSAVLCDVAINPQSGVGDVRKRIGKPWQTTKRTMEALTMLGLLTCDETTEPSMNEGGETDGRKKWEYRLADNIDCDALLAMAGLDNPFATVGSVRA